MNNVTLVGRLVRDPDIRYTGQGQETMCIARFTLAVDRRRKSQNGESDADFPSCIAFGKTAEFFEKYIHQGMKIGVRGRIQTGSYTNKDNQKVYTTDVIVDEAEFCEKKQENTAQGNAQNYAQSQGTQQPYQANAQQQNMQTQRATQQYQQRTNGYAGSQQNGGPIGEGFINIPDSADNDALPWN